MDFARRSSSAAISTGILTPTSLLFKGGRDMGVWFILYFRHEKRETTLASLTFRSGVFIDWKAVSLVRTFHYIF